MVCEKIKHIQKVSELKRRNRAIVLKERQIGALDLALCIELGIVLDHHPWEQVGVSNWHHSNSVLIQKREGLLYSYLLSFLPCQKLCIICVFGCFSF